MRNIKQLRAITYAIAARKEKEADKMVAELKEKNITVEKSKYPEVTLHRCRKAKREAGLI